MSSTALSRRLREQELVATLEAAPCIEKSSLTRRSANPESIEHGVTGFLVDTPAKAVEAVARIDQIDRAVVGASVVSRFSVDRMAEAHITLYRRIISEGHGRLPTGRSPKTLLEGGSSNKVNAPPVSTSL